MEEEEVHEEMEEDSRKEKLTRLQNKRAGEGGKR